MTKLKRLISNNAVLCIALFAAAVTSFIVPPDSEYLGYFDLRTLTCLFCVLAVVCALRNINFFYILARKIVIKFKNARMCVLALVYITFIGSMLIANDMALLTFLPLGYLALETSGKSKHLAFTFIMQNIAANLGGMLTPFGNPQNLYIYSKFEIPNIEFMAIMLIPFLAAVILITVCCFVFVKPEPLEVRDSAPKLDIKRAVLYTVLFIISIAIVFRSIPYWVGLVIIPPVLMFLDRKALKDVDYGLLLTFAAFFVFSGNLSRIPLVSEFFSFLLSKSVLVVSAFSCQFISNVPTAILLSRFTDNYRELLLGVNVGGVGTLISSLASLITFREYSRRNPSGVKKYIAEFSAFNFAFLFILTAVSFISLSV